MAKFRITLNMEFCRSADKGFEQGLELASKMGYKYVEPMVHTGWELLSELNYFHSFSLENDPMLMGQLCKKRGVKISSISGHGPLMRPEAAIGRLIRSIIIAFENGSKFVNTDEGLRPEWMSEDSAWEIMRYTLKRVMDAAERHKVFVCIEPHGEFSRTSAGLLKILSLSDSPYLKINWDTGNSYIAGVEDPYEGLEKVKKYVWHMHAKDISLSQSQGERGKVTGTPVGCACGEGVVDWKRIAEIMESEDREIFLSVECGTIAQAEYSINYLRDTLKDYIVE